MKTDKIEKGIYQGYIWMSDQVKPLPQHIFINSEYEGCELNANQNPFIIEALMYEVEKHISYKVRYADGKYFATKTELDAPADKSAFKEKKFFAHRIDGVSRLIFRQYWNTVKDEMCLNMETYQPGELVFIGFEEKEENHD